MNESLPEPAVMPLEHQGRPIDELRTSGLLWLINRIVFHPRGFALALVADDEGNASGWEVLGDGTEPWRYEDEASEDNRFTAAEATLAAAREAAPAATGSAEPCATCHPLGWAGIDAHLAQINAERQRAERPHLPRTSQVACPHGHWSRPMPEAGLR